MRVNMLLSSAGRRVELLHLFRAAARDLGIDLTIVASDAEPTMSAACQFVDHVEAVPPVSHQSYASAVTDLCARHRIDLVVPLIDPDVTAWSLIKVRVAELFGTRVAVSSPDVVAICRDKRRTAETLREGGLLVPRTWAGQDFDPRQDRLAWPLICKPAAGSSSVGIREWTTPDMALLDPAGESDIVQERVFGREITVNAFYGGDGRLLYSIPHERLEVRSGEVSKGRTLRVAAIADTASRLATMLPGLWGPVCFQGMLRDDGSFVIFQINARFGGGYPIAHEAGARGPRFFLQDVLGRSLQTFDDYRSGLTMLRYDRSVIVEE